MTYTFFPTQWLKLNTISNFSTISKRSILKGFYSTWNYSVQMRQRNRGIGGNLLQWSTEYEELFHWHNWNKFDESKSKSQYETSIIKILFTDIWEVLCFIIIAYLLLFLISIICTNLKSSSLRFCCYRLVIFLSSHLYL